MVIPPEAIRAAAHAMSFDLRHRGSGTAIATAALEAALPHLRPLFETVTQVALELGRKEALDQTCGCILGPVHTLGDHLHLGATGEVSHG